jgi:hypothetical protein
MSLLLAACATPYRAAGPVAPVPPAPGAALRAAHIEPDVEARILALDPLHVTDKDVRETLAKGPTPRIVNIHGGIYPVHLVMESFGRFLIRMGYPENKVRDPASHDLSHTPYEDSVNIAGELAWMYEHDGMAPLLIGHSQGGMQVVKVLYELAGKFDDRIDIVDPLEELHTGRTSFVDPLTGATRPVTSLVIGYASAVAAGGAATLLPNQWSMASRLYRIPDSVIEFTGFELGLDLVAWDGPGDGDRYKALGTANVRNVHLPAAYSHVFVVDTGGLAKDEHMRAWLNAWTPALQGHAPPAELDLPNVLWAADVWYSIKKWWVIEAQEFIRARQALAPG